MQYFMNFLHKSKKHRRICSIPSKLLLIIHYVASQHFKDVSGRLQAEVRRKIKSIRAAMWREIILNQKEQELRVKVAIQSLFIY